MCYTTEFFNKGEESKKKMFDQDGKINFAPRDLVLIEKESN